MAKRSNSLYLRVSDDGRGLDFRDPIDLGGSDGSGSSRNERKAVIIGRQFEHSIYLCSTTIGLKFHWRETNREPNAIRERIANSSLDPMLWTPVNGANASNFIHRRPKELNLQLDTSPLSSCRYP